MSSKTDTKLQKKYAQLKANAEKYQAMFQADSSCRNLRNYNHALAALKQFEQKYIETDMPCR